MMRARVHILGASGSGTTTLGRAVATALRVPHIDSDDYYWMRTAEPYTVKRKAEERVELLRSKLHGQPSWVLSGSLCGWGDALIPEFTHAVLTELDTPTRMKRLAARERARFGESILPGRERHHQYIEFMNWAQSYDLADPPVRSRRLHDLWLAQLTCPILRVRTDAPINEVTNRVLNSVAA